MEDQEQKGVPIYLDPFNRKLVDTAEATHSPHEWHPMNGPAQCLLKCREAIQDINEILENYARTESPKKRRRRLRAIFVPLHSLCDSVINLINGIQSNTQVHDRLPAGATKELTELRSRFISLVPFDRKGKLGMLRNKVAAHYEKDMSPGEMRDLYAQTDSTEIGEWLHISISVLCDLLKLDAYMWTAAGSKEGTTVILCQEPVMTVFETKNNEIVGIEGFFVPDKSPRTMVFEDLKETAELSQPLFERKCTYRLAKFVEDKKGDKWAKTIETTNQISEANTNSKI